jgi:hypothetical protein
MERDGHDPLDDDLARLRRRLAGVRRRLEAQAGSARRRMDALAPAGLFALAAEEERRAEFAQGQRRAAHRAAAQAAERLAEERLGCHPA